MSMKSGSTRSSADAPVLDDRDRAAVLSDLRSHIPGYTPEWTPVDGTASSALLHIFARYMEIAITGLNQVPDRSFLAFLDMLGTHLLPAQAARAPLVFSLMDPSPLDVTLPANSQVAAPIQPPPPSPLLSPDEKSAPPQPLLFATTQTVTLARAHLTSLYSLHPGSDEYADHTSRLTAGFTLFDDLQPVEHALYLGHDQLFALAGNAQVRLSFSLGATDPATARRDLDFAWQYLSEDGWLPLVIKDKEKDDGTEGLTKDGEIMLQKSCGPDAKEETISGHKSYWLRGRLLTPLPPQSAEGVGVVPLVDTVRARVGFTKSDLQAEAAFNDAVPIDTSKDFYPFSQQPARFSTFYLASKEAFQRRGARIRIEVRMSAAGVAGNNLGLAWEYHNGTEWRRLDNPDFEFQDDTAGFTKATPNSNDSKSLSFLCPLDWAESEVNGANNYWLRARIAAGDYGKPMSIAVDNSATPQKVTVVVSTLQPPVIASLRLAYTYQTEPTLLDHCLAFNDFVFTDHSHSIRWPRSTFEPFRPVADRQPTIYFGFSRALPSGLISLYLHVPSEAVEGDREAEASGFLWEYRGPHGWNELGVLDETRGFRRSGMIQFIGPRDAVAEPGLGGEQFRIRARLKQGERMQTAPVTGVWLNAVWGTHRISVEGDVLGTGDGNPGQTLHFLRQRVPVLEGEVITIREWTGRGADWETAVQDVPEQDLLRLDRDPVTNKVTSVWVRWHERPHLYDSGPTDRHYVIERATGLLRFGDGQHGRIPPAGGRITATYSSGGGLSGNLPVGAISQLRAAVPYVTGVTNPVPASGGAATEALGAVRARGPQRLRHRDRAVSMQDFEWLAHEASPDVARVRCLPVTGPVGRVQRGWVSLVILPHSEEAQPAPSPELKRRVREHLAGRVPAAVAAQVRVMGPQYVPVGVVAEIVPRRPDEAAQVEARVLDRLNRFLHPLIGGSDAGGWAFGQSIYLSQVAALIENTPGVDYARRIGLRVGQQVFDEHVPVDPHVLVAAGDHELKLTLGGI